MDHHWMDSQFATASSDETAALQVWDPQRTAPLQSYSGEQLWNSPDTIHTIRYNPAERALLAHCAADRGVALTDTRSAQNLAKTVLRMKCNDLQWNPMEPMNFVVANEDASAYTFDMRNLAKPTRIYKGHVAAVMCVAWSPTGRELVTGSYDRTLRIFDTHTGGGHARDMYHTKRMQRVFTVDYTMDHQFILSGSDDGNVRLWKAVSSTRMGQATTREQASQEYRQALIRRYQHVPEVRRIVKSRNVPRALKNQAAQAREQKEAADRKQANRIKYDRKGEYKQVPEREKAVVRKID